MEQKDALIRGWVAKLEQIGQGIFIECSLITKFLSFERKNRLQNFISFLTRNH